MTNKSIKLTNRTIAMTDIEYDKIMTAIKLYRFENKLAEDCSNLEVNYRDEEWVDFPFKSKKVLLHTLVNTDLTTFKVMMKSLRFKKETTTTKSGSITDKLIELNKKLSKKYGTTNDILESINELTDMLNEVAQRSSHE